MSYGMQQLVVMLVTLYVIGIDSAPSYQGCGERVRLRGRITGGNQSRPGMWPWQVRLLKESVFRFKEYDTICGGALIAPQWVMTAAHCFYTRRISSSKIWFEKDISPLTMYRIVAGDIYTNVKEQSEQEFKIIKVHIHPGYRHAPYYENDIALIKLNMTASLNPYVRTVCLPDTSIDLAKPGTTGAVAGWGMTKRAFRSTILLHTTVPIQNNTVCDLATYYFFNSTVTFCAGDGQGTTDSCKGDSGGSLVRNVLVKGHHRWVTVGVVSWGEGCSIKGKYGYYTRVSPFVGWIKDKIRNSASFCLRPGNVSNGRLLGAIPRRVGIGTRVTYKCLRGFIFKGKSERKCRRNGKWTRPPVCIREPTCPAVGHPRNGIRSPSKGPFRYKSKMLFYCNRNHVMIGKLTLICQRDGKWNGYPPSCLAPCRNPGVPKNGIRLGNNFRHGQTIRFLCKKKSKMIGSNFIMCGNGRWFNKIPTCEIDYSTCGISRTNLRARIIGGNKAGRGTWPWQVGVYLLHSRLAGSKKRFVCGGSLISRHWVLSSAQCFSGRNLQPVQASTVSIRVGDYVISVKESSEVEHDAERIFIHPKFRHVPFFDYDIALVKLSKQVKLGPFVRPICLPKRGEHLIQPGKYGIVAGWGTTEALQLGQAPMAKNRISKRLMHSAFTIQSNIICANTPFYFDKNVTFCAGNGKGGNDSCVGDSGGSFMRELPRGNEYRWVTTGLVSWGNGCGLEGNYGYYTLLEPFIDWINKTIEDNS